MGTGTSSAPAPAALLPSAAIPRRWLRRALPHPSLPEILQRGAGSIWQRGPRLPPPPRTGRRWSQLLRLGLDGSVPLKGDGDRAGEGDSSGVPRPMLWGRNVASPRQPAAVPHTGPTLGMRQPSEPRQTHRTQGPREPSRAQLAPSRVLALPGTRRPCPALPVPTHFCPPTKSLWMPHVPWHPPLGRVPIPVHRLPAGGRGRDNEEEFRRRKELPSAAKHPAVPPQGTRLGMAGDRR